MTAATMLFASSCSKEQISTTVPVGEEVTVTLTADLGAIESRAISDGLKVNEVAWAIYTAGADTPLPDFQGILPINEKKGTLEVRLVTGRSYDIALFAYATADPTLSQQNVAVPNPTYYKVDWNNKLVEVDFTAPVANDDDARDCFWHVEKGLLIDRPITKTFTLTRPLAQLNFGVTAADTVAAADAGLSVKSSKIVASSYTKFNLFDGVCSDIVELTFDKNIVPNQALEVEEIGYTYIGTTYLLLDQKMLQDIKLTIYDTKDTEINTLKYTNVPFQRNYRTNILGALLTNPADFTIKVDERFNEPDFVSNNKVVTPDANGVYNIDEAEELAWLAAAVNSGDNDFAGKKVVIPADAPAIDLKGVEWTPIGTAGKPFKGSFDGNGVVIRNLTVKASEFAGLFGSVLSDKGITNVALENVVIEANHYAGAIAGHAYADITNCTVDGLTLTVTPNELTRSAYDNGDKVGGIVGYVAERNGSAAGYTISGNTVKNAEITAYRDLGGIAGAAYIAECAGNTVADVTLTVDQTVNNYGDKDANLGEVVGRVLGGTVGENTVENVELVYNPITLKPCTPLAEVEVDADKIYQVKGMVVAVGTSAYFISDGTAALMVYGNNHKRSIGDYVVINGKVSRYSNYNTNALQIVATKTEVASTGNTPVYSPKVLTATEIDALVGNTATSTEVELVGTAYLNDKGFINIDIEGGKQDASLYYVSVNNYKHLVGSQVTVKGYITGTYNTLNVLPYEVIDNKKESEWGIVGAMNNWGDGIKDITLYTYDYKLMFAKGVEVEAGQEFKIRANNKWDDAKNYGMEKPQTVCNDMELPLICGGGSQNMKFLESGKFDIYFDLTNSKAYVMTAGKNISEAAKYEEYVAPLNLHEKGTWGLVGSFNGWDVENSLPMTIDGDYAVVKKVALSKNDEFKFAANNAWALSYGSGCEVKLEDEYQAYENGGNMKFVGESGVFNIYFSMKNATFYMKDASVAEPVETEGGRDDFGSLKGTNTSYTSGKTTNGWTYTYCAILSGGSSDNNPVFKSLFGTSTSTKALTMNGKTSAKGSITSPVINTGCHTLSFDYGLPFSENKGISFKVEIIQDGKTVQTYTVSNSSTTKLKKYSWSQEIKVLGDFQIKFSNNSPSNSSSNKDRYAIFNVVWSGYGVE